MKKNLLNMRKSLLLTLLLPFLLLSNFAFGQSGFILEDTIINKLNTCGTKAEICINSLNVSQVSLANIKVNGKPYIGTPTACKADTILAYDFSNFGGTVPPPYTLDSLTINGKFFGGKTFPTLKALADSLSTWDITADWSYNDQTKKMTGGKTSSKYSALVISTTIIVTQNKVGLNIGVESKGAKFLFDEGTNKVVVEIPSLGLKDSLYIYVVCPKKDISTKNIKIGSTEKYCIDKKDLPAGKVFALKNYNPIASNSPIALSILKGDSCIEVKGLKKGKDTLLLVATGQKNVLDTTIYYINVDGVPAKLGNHFVTKDVYEGKKAQYCINTDAILPTPADEIETITNICPTKSGTDVKFTITGKNPCIDLDGLKAGGQDTACIVITNKKGLKDTTTIYSRVLKDCNGLIKLDSIVDFIADCSLKGQICLPELKPADSLKYSIIADGNLYIDDKVGCAFDTIIAYNYSIMLINGKLLPPPYSVDKWTINGSKKMGNFNTIKELVDQMNIWDPKGKWELDSVKQLIIGGFPSQKYSPIYITNQTFLVESELGFNIGLNARGIALSFERGVHEIVITETATGCTDKIKAFVSCIKTDYISNTIEEGTKDTVCLDLKELFSDPTSTVNILNDGKNKNVDFTISADKKCIYYTGNKIGADTAIIVACDKYKFCDTTYIYIDVIKKGPSKGGVIVLKDTIFVGDMDKICIDTAKYLKGQKFKDFTIKYTEDVAKLELDQKTFCIKYTGNKPGLQKGFIYLCSTIKCDTFDLQVTVIPKPVPNDIVLDEVPLLSTKKICIPAAKYAGIDLNKKPLVVKNVCPKTNSFVTYTITPDTTCKAPSGFGYALSFKGNKIGKDTACVEVTDSSGKKQIIKFVVTVKPRTPYIVKDTLLVPTQKSYCLENSKLDLTSGIDSVFNYCPKKGGSPVATFAIIKDILCPSGFRVVVSAIAPGKDTACFSIKDKLGNKDTATFYITILKPIPQPKLVLDTIVKFSTKSYCIDTLGLNVKGIVSIKNECPQKSGEFVIFDIKPNGKCITKNGVPGIEIVYTGADVGKDTACWVLTDNKGKKDTVTMVVWVRLPKPSIVVDSVDIDDTIVLCPDSTEVDKKIDTIYNFCPKTVVDNVTFTKDKNSNCYIIKGIKIGIDTACIVVIDQFGLKDTTTFIVKVKPKGSTKLIAVDDAVTTPKNKPIDIVVIKNDTFKDTTKLIITIIPKANGGKGPNHGATIGVDNKKGIVKYMPDFDFCGTDTFTYKICIGGKCDTADVVVTIDCDTSSTLEVYNAFSPNEDGINEVFTIKGITNPIFKGNVLAIFNRWGNEVYKKTDYDNTWNGTWNDGGMKLPDGTYWYVLCYPEGGETKIKSGYLVLRR
jgi:gliding motility-associated-like protein